MEIDTLEYSQVKATSVSVCLQIFLCAFNIPNKLSGTIVGDCASLEPSLSMYPFSFTTILTSPQTLTTTNQMDFTPIYKFFAPKGDLLEPPPSSHPILTNGYELHPALIAMVLEQSFSRLVDEDPYTHLREFEQLCSCWTIAVMTKETIKWKLFPFSLSGRAKQWYAHSVGGVNGN